MKEIEIRFTLKKDGHVAVVATGDCTEYDYISLMACGVESMLSGMSKMKGAGKYEYLGLFTNELLRNIGAREDDKNDSNEA